MVSKAGYDEFVRMSLLFNLMSLIGFVIITVSTEQISHLSFVAVPHAIANLLLLVFRNYIIKQLQEGES